MHLARMFDPAGLLAVDVDKGIRKILCNAIFNPCSKNGTPNEIQLHSETTAQSQSKKQPFSKYCIHQNNPNPMAFICEVDTAKRTI